MQHLDLGYMGFKTLEKKREHPAQNSGDEWDIGAMPIHPAPFEIKRETPADVKDIKACVLANVNLQQNPAVEDNIPSWISLEIQTLLEKIKKTEEAKESVDPDILLKYYFLKGLAKLAPKTVDFFYNEHCCSFFLSKENRKLYKSFDQTCTRYILKSCGYEYNNSDINALLVELNSPFPSDKTFILECIKKNRWLPIKNLKDLTIFLSQISNPLVKKMVVEKNLDKVFLIRLIDKASDLIDFLNQIPEPELRKSILKKLDERPACEQFPDESSSFTHLFRYNNPEKGLPLLIWIRKQSYLEKEFIEKIQRIFTRAITVGKDLKQAFEIIANLPQSPEDKNLLRDLKAELFKTFLNPSDKVKTSRCSFFSKCCHSAGSNKMSKDLLLSIKTKIVESILQVKPLMLTPKEIQVAVTDPAFKLAFEILGPKPVIRSTGRARLIEVKPAPRKEDFASIVPRVGI